MAPAPPTTTWTHLHRPFLRPLALVLATRAFRPASSQLIFTPPTAGATFAGALTPPPPPTDGGLGGGTFNVATSILFVGVIVALFLVGFFSAYLRRCADAATAAQRGGDANAAVAAAAAAAFSSAASRGSRRRGAAGLGTAAMEALPVLTYARARAVKAGRGALECAVCLAEFTDDGEKLRLLPGCCHVFHAACIDVWLAAHATCPVCRADLADPAVAAAGRVLSADLAADHVELETASADHTVVDVETTASTPGGQEEEEITAEERADRYTLRLPERLRREIEDAKRLRRAVSAVTAASASSSSGRWGLPSALRTMSAARPSRRWSALFRALSGPHRSDLDGRVAPLQVQTHPASTRDNVEVVVVRRGDDVGTETEKHYAHSLTFAGFIIDGDVASGDWNPEVFQVSSAVPAPAPSQP